MAAFREALAYEALLLLFMMFRMLKRPQSLGIRQWRIQEFRKGGANQGGPLGKFKISGVFNTPYSTSTLYLALRSHSLLLIIPPDFC